MSDEKKKDEAVNEEMVEEEYPDINAEFQGDEEEEVEAKVHAEPMKLKLRLTVEGLGVRVASHKTNPEMVILKSCKCAEHRMLLGTFVEQLGLIVGSSWEGKNYLISEVSRDSWTAALQKIVSEEAFLEVPPKPTVLVAPGPVDSDGDPLPQ